MTVQRWNKIIPNKKAYEFSQIMLPQVTIFEFKNYDILMQHKFCSTLTPVHSINKPKFCNCTIFLTRSKVKVHVQRPKFTFSECETRASEPKTEQRFKNKEFLQITSKSTGFRDVLTGSDQNPAIDRFHHTVQTKKHWNFSFTISFFKFSDFFTKNDFHEAQRN